MEIKKVIIAKRLMDLTNYDNFLELKLFDGYAYIDVNENSKKGKQHIEEHILKKI